jgi:hypothetical protein
MSPPYWKRAMRCRPVAVPASSFAVAFQSSPGALLGNRVAHVVSFTSFACEWIRCALGFRRSLRR